MTITAGPIIWILVILAVSAVVVFVERLLELRRSHIDVEDFVKGIINVLEQDNIEEALSLCDETDVPIARVVSAAVRSRQSSARVLREAVESASRMEKSRLSRRLASLKIIGDIAPLIGLLGTIFGFIHAVIKVNGDALVTRADLIGSTMESLLAAALGLMIAIPVVVMHSMLQTRLQRLIVEIDAAASRITGYISTKAVQK